MRTALALACLLLLGACSRQPTSHWRPCDCAESTAVVPARLEIVPVFTASHPELAPFSYQGAQYFLAPDSEPLCSLEDVASAAVLGDPEYPPYLALWLTEDAHQRVWEGAAPGRHTFRQAAIRLDGVTVEVTNINQPSRMVALILTPADQCRIVCQWEADAEGRRHGV